MSQLFIGIMSGSSLDGVDVALTEFCDNQCKVIATHFLPYSADIKKILLTLHTPIINELENSVLAGNALALIYAGAVNTLLVENNFSPKQITAIGCHGQTIRHCPQKTDGVGYTIQIGNHALLSERTNITVIGDFRSRDIAAGGQGAPLVPAFHQALFGSVRKNRAIINIGGIANITYLSKSGLDDAGDVIGFDSGPGNMLLDSWIKLKRDKDYDLNGQWAATGKVIDSLLINMLSEPYFALQPPKSTGRDLFNSQWLTQYILNFDGGVAKEDPGKSDVLEVEVDCFCGRGSSVVGRVECQDT